MIRITKNVPKIYCKTTIKQSNICGSYICGERKNNLTILCNSCYKKNDMKCKLCNNTSTINSIEIEHLSVLSSPMDQFINNPIIIKHVNKPCTNCTIGV